MVQTLESMPRLSFRRLQAHTFNLSGFYSNLSMSWINFALQAAVR
jgi:hypothetical protein